MRIFRSKQNKLIAFGLTIAVALVSAGTVLAGWGPIRPTFTWANPATYITFNSITDNPFFGDERAFLMTRDASAGTNTYTDIIDIENNKEYIVQIYFHNNARSDLNLVAQNTRVRVDLPTNTNTGLEAIGFISADNANPGTVHDTVGFTNDKPVKLQYVPGSAYIRTNLLNDVALSDSIVTSSGALIGYSALNGQVPCCAVFSLWVIIKVKAIEQPTVVPAYACTLLDVKTSAGRKVDATITYSTSGGATFKNVTFTWGDGNTTLTTNTTASHTYGADGNYTINATLKFDVGGTEQTAVCSKSVTFTTPPVTPPVTPPAGKLPDTGPGSTAAALFVGVSSFAGIFHSLW